MYGTVARFRVKSGMEGQLQQIVKEQEREQIPGSVATYVYQMDTDPREFYLAVLFTDKEAYWANARNPEQDARYRQLLSVLEQEPEWHDGQIVYVEQEQVAS